jgi:small-conductance mechanosensitive channel
MMEKKTIESELRYKIDELFRAHHIVIAFPQRDVHLDSVKPVEVRIVQTDNNTKEIAD